MNALKTFTSALLLTVGLSTSMFAAGAASASASENKPVTAAVPVHETPVHQAPTARVETPAAQEPTSVEKKQIVKKKGVFRIKDNIKGAQRTMDGGGIYISVGALIIILILLIIFV